MLRTDSGAHPLMELIYNLYKSHYDRSSQREYETQIMSQARNVNPHAAIGDMYLDSSPSGTYARIGDHVTISSEAYAILQETRKKEIEEIVRRGESLQAKGVSFEEYRSRISPGMTRDTYDFLCYEGKSKKYFKDQALAVFDRWANGENFSPDELRKWSQYAGDEYDQAEYQRGLNQQAAQLKEAFKTAGITLEEDEKFEFRLSTNARFVVSGIHDDVKREKIEEVVNQTLNRELGQARAFHIRYQNVRGLPRTPETATSDSRAIYSAAAVGFSEDFLTKYADGVTLNDLSLDAQGKIAGKLPQEILDKLNNAAHPKDSVEYEKMTKEQQEWSGNRYMLRDAIKNVTRYGYDKLPQVGFSFVFTNGRMSVNDPSLANR